ncbi:hypothetical protein LguiA_001952 [Lonicera macranthoides]
MAALGAPIAFQKHWVMNLPVSLLPGNAFFTSNCQLSSVFSNLSGCRKAFGSMWQATCFIREVSNILLPVYPYGKACRKAFQTSLFQMSSRTTKHFFCCWI